MFVMGGFVEGPLSAVGSHFKTNAGGRTMQLSNSIGHVYPSYAPFPGSSPRAHVDHALPFANKIKKKRVYIYIHYHLSCIHMPSYDSP